jgi:hypothetical protein
MKYFLFIGFFYAMIFMSVDLNAQSKKYDSTLRMGKVGFGLFCNNRDPDQNELDIKLIGFQGQHDARFYVKGRVRMAEIDDLNNDGYPDIVLYSYSGDDGVYGNVLAFSSQENKSLVPFTLPDIMLDGKLNEGYKGHDEFSLMEGTLLQKFPVYKPGDDKDHPTGGRRFVQYQVVHAENGGFKFKVLRTYEVK